MRQSIIQWRKLKITSSQQTAPKDKILLILRPDSSHQHNGLRMIKTFPNPKVLLREIEKIPNKEFLDLPLPQLLVDIKKKQQSTLFQSETPPPLGRREAQQGICRARGEHKPEVYLCWGQQPYPGPSYLPFLSAFHYQTKSIPRNCSYIQLS